MVKKISWTPRAICDRFEILEYWSNRNKSKTYSRKLYQEFASNIKLVASNPELGKSTEFPSVRMIIVDNYIVYYSVDEKEIEVAAIWDPRRNPAKLKL